MKHNTSFIALLWQLTQVFCSILLHESYILIVRTPVDMFYFVLTRQHLRYCAQNIVFALKDYERITDYIAWIHVCVFLCTYSFFLFMQNIIKFNNSKILLTEVELTLLRIKVFWVQVQLRTEVLCSTSFTRPGFELMTSRSWQYTSCHWNACSNHSAISDLQA